MTVHLGTDRTRSRSSFYPWIAVIAGLIVVVGFSRTYYLKAVFGTPELPPLRHLHGLVMTVWFALFFIQTTLVAKGRTDLHRRLGILGALWAVLVVVVGVMTAIDAGRRGASPGPPPLMFLVVPLADMLVFSTLAGAGLWVRRRSDVHKRLMLVATLSMLPAAIARIPLAVVQANRPLVPFGLTDVIILSCVAYDTWTHRRVHPAFGWAALLVVASHPLRFMLAQTDAWMRFATWVTQ
jgi:hypothetical protein